MKTLWNNLKKLTVFQWWLFAVLSFWFPTMFFVFVDFAGATWFGVTWPGGPDLFPNEVLGYPLALFQILALVFLVVSGIRLVHTHPNGTGIALGVGLVVVTGVVCFVAYIFFTF